MVALHDGHGNADHPEFTPNALLPIACDWIENKLVVTGIGDGLSGINRGDVILAMNGRPTAELMAEKEALISGATPQWRQSREVLSVLAGRDGDLVALDVQSGNAAPRTVTLTRKA